MATTLRGIVVLLVRSLIFEYLYLGLGIYMIDIDICNMTITMRILYYGRALLNELSNLECFFEDINWLNFKL